MRAGERRVRLVAVAIAALALASCGSGASSDASRQADVAERGRQVMPFDLEATTHTFTKTAAGGVQDVTAKDPGDAAQIELIRGHLRSERDKFAAGDFEDPARIHGMDMPGVAELAAGYREVDVRYEDTTAGARLTYTTTDPALVDAIHAWFDRQLMDHGAHAHAG